MIVYPPIFYGAELKPAFKGKLTWKVADTLHYISLWILDRRNPRRRHSSSAWLGQQSLCHGVGVRSQSVKHIFLEIMKQIKAMGMIATHIAR